MPIEDAKRFIEWAPAQPAVAARLAALRGREALDGLCRIAAECGFRFDAGEYRAAVMDECGEELSDAAIAEVQRELGIADRS